MEDIITKVAPVTKCIAPTMPDEEWRLIEDPRLRPRYWVSNQGRVWNNETKRLLTIRTIAKGYKAVYVVDHNHNTIGLLVHRILAVAFNLPRREDQTCIDHIDGDPGNNSLNNLRWVTPLENSSNSVTRNRQVMANKRETAQRLNAVYCTELDCYFSCPEEAAELCGLHTEMVRHSCRTGRPIGKRTGNKFAPDIEALHFKYLPRDRERPSTAPRRCANDSIVLRKNSKPVMCLNDNKPYPSVKAAAVAYSVTEAGVSASCKRYAEGKSTARCQGLIEVLHFKWMTQEEYLAVVGDQQIQVG